MGGAGTGVLLRLACGAFSSGTNWARLAIRSGSKSTYRGFHLLLAKAIVTNGHGDHHC